MSRENAKLELYSLFCQCASALLIAIINAAETSGPRTKMVIKEKILQLTNTLHLYLVTPPLLSEQKFAASRSIRDMTADLQSSGRYGQSVYGSAQSTLPKSKVRPFKESIPSYRETPLRPNVRTRPRHLGMSGNTTEADFRHIPVHSTMIGADQSLPNASATTRFPIVQNLLKALAESPNEDVYSKAILPFAKDSHFTDQLTDEMDMLRSVLSEDASPETITVETTLSDRLGLMESSIQRLISHIDKLETTFAGDKTATDEKKEK
ncbi:uncharacterized protein LOC129768714 [Toxorhynchites rutilus septentrionalis]|uniref:uncharacterized protein LOC129768714 n=1 Tax=Toxorhynchites rutilus septentrionalis TaxID=329112 RepID=UPI00247A014D|nr:uncharacterized protein LOC129768714 [Toxorhynchites rutilus septentrionalis]